MSERDRMKATRMELKEKRRHMVLTSEALRNYMRELLYILIEPENLEGEKILMLATQLKEKNDELIENKSKINILDRELGG